VSAGPAPLRDFALKVVIVFAIAAALAAAWVLREVVLLFFGAVLFAIVFHAGARLVMRLAPVGYGWALAMSTTAMTVVLAGLLVFFGLGLEAQASQLMTQLPEAWDHLREVVGALPGGEALDRLLDELNGPPSLQLLRYVRGYAASFGKGLLDVLLIVVAGLYLAAQPRLYTGGAVRLLPEASRGAARRLLAESGAMLRRWFVAQLIAMVAIGVMFGVGLWALGVPAAGALGVFAGVAEFIPLIGPILAAVPVLLSAAGGGLDQFLGALALYVAIHAFESNLLQPLLLRGMTSIPPVLILFALVVSAIFFGLLGIMLAAPLTIVLMVVVRDLYLHERAPPFTDPGEAEARGA
jgi:predicted PurR-regulated permease PerM